MDMHTDRLAGPRKTGWRLVGRLGRAVTSHCFCQARQQLRNPELWTYSPANWYRDFWLHGMCYLLLLGCQLCCIHILVVCTVIVTDLEKRFTDLLKNKLKNYWLLWQSLADLIMNTKQTTVQMRKAQYHNTPNKKWQTNWQLMMEIAGL